MTAKITLMQLHTMLMNEQQWLNALQSQDDITDSTIASMNVTRKNIRNLQMRIANRERYDVMRSLGLKKTPYGWE